MGRSGTGFESRSKKTPVVQLARHHEDGRKLQPSALQLLGSVQTITGDTKLLKGGQRELFYFKEIHL